MVYKSKAENAAAAVAASIPRGAYSLDEFCAAHNISMGLYRKLREQGLGPRETRILRRVVISVEAAAAWRREREAASAAETEVQ
ncbi:hypothetical protein [Bradyrhizobium japonicum]|uniref:hypothetical protein n=1 Tax=Bradyrhizobium japonicum TaxID=375 RepID=UPI001E401BE8|nr:hypothetical protein [Bradyrhizobium japonicum]MCD9821619.1 hypothetical protein [Bradyrhizobium japonicum]MEB2678422.1 hypothetical protein [Bradyrhizobium japonicum]WRI88658.1 hypothetical protein R3F75_43700 [Bradyrhizobium japonicum]